MPPPLSVTVSTTYRLSGLPSQNNTRIAIKVDQVIIIHCPESAHLVTIFLNIQKCRCLPHKRQEFLCSNEHSAWHAGRMNKHKAMYNPNSADITPQYLRLPSSRSLHRKGTIARRAIRGENQRTLVTYASPVRHSYRKSFPTSRNRNRF